jgi:hypothetical protein
MKLTPTRVVNEYHLKDKSGYSYLVTAEFFPGCGWTATLAMKCAGLNTAEAAVEGLKDSAEQFLKQLAKLEKGTV